MYIVLLVSLNVRHELRLRHAQTCNQEEPSDRIRMSQVDLNNKLLELDQVGMHMHDDAGISFWVLPELHPPHRSLPDPRGPSSFKSSDRSSACLTSHLGSAACLWHLPA